MYIASCRRDTWWHRSPETTKVDANRRFTIARSVAACKLPEDLMHGPRSSLNLGATFGKGTYIVASPRNLAMMYCTFPTLERETRENCVLSASVSHSVPSHRILSSSCQTFAKHLISLREMSHDVSPVKDIQLVLWTFNCGVLYNKNCEHFWTRWIEYNDNGIFLFFNYNNNIFV